MMAQLLLQMTLCNGQWFDYKLDQYYTEYEQLMGFILKVLLVDYDLLAGSVTSEPFELSHYLVIFIVVIDSQSRVHSAGLMGMDLIRKQSYQIAIDMHGGRVTWNIAII